MKRSAIIFVALAAITSGLEVAYGGSQPEVTTRFFQGIPGVEIDLCIDGTEVASSVPYRTTVDGPSYESDPTLTEHDFEFREADVGSCSGAIVSEDYFWALKRAKVLLIAHQWRDGSPRSETWYMRRRPPTREGRTRFTVGHFAAAPNVFVALDGHRLVSLQNGGGRYVFNQFEAGRHRFAFRTKSTSELLATRTVKMPEGVDWFLILYGDATSGYRIRAFHRNVGVR